MKKVLAFSLFAVFTTAASAQTPTISRPFKSDECMVSYETAANRREFKAVKKTLASKWLKELPIGREAAACNDELKLNLKISAIKCEIFCNPTQK